jgi:hypothetical protein
MVKRVLMRLASDVGFKLIDQLALFNDHLADHVSDRYDPNELALIKHR